MQIIIIVLLFVLWLRFVLNRVSKKNTASSKEFWSRERAANSTRKKDISNLNYITFFVEDLPFITTEHPRINEFQDRLKQLSTQKILNLNNKSNTDLKLEYGVSNLTSLTEYDQNFILLVRTLYQLGSCLYENQYIEEAKDFLQFGIACQSDISGNYVLLANIYKQAGDTSSIQNLIASAQGLETLLKHSIIHSLQEILDSTASQ